MFAVSFPSLEAVKNQLVQWNPHCVIRTRGSSNGGRNVRLGCKFENAGCPLNVSCVQRNSGNLGLQAQFKMSAGTYRPGNCSALKPVAQSAQSLAPSAQSLAPSAESLAPSAESLECCLCSLTLLTSCPFTRCRKDHVFCRGCFNGMVRNQVTGVGKVRFVASKTVHCVVCRPNTEISVREAAQHLSPEVWNQYLAALSEGDVVAEQERFQTILQKCQSTASSPMDDAMIIVRSKIQPQCPKCSKVVPEFDACAALVCGRVIGLQGSLLGCGAHLCGWCLRVCSAQDHSSHVSYCQHNPRPGEVFPESTTVWRGVQNFLARQRVLQFIATLPRGLAGDVLRATSTEFPEVLKTASLESDVSLQQRHDSTDRMLRPNPQPRHPSFLGNVDTLVSLNIATQTRAEQVLESNGNDLQAAIDLLLAV